MIKTIGCIIISLSIYISVLPANAGSSKVNFSGSWKLDTDKSESMDAIFSLQNISWIKKKLGARLDVKPVITQTDDGLTIIFDNIAGKTTQQLYFDGKEHLTKNPAGHDAWLTTSWVRDGNRLKSTGSVVTEDGTKGTLTEIRSLSEDSQTMYLIITAKMSDGKSASVKRIFRKKK